jgi:hypothetical protein
MFRRSLTAAMIFLLAVSALPPWGAAPVEAADDWLPEIADSATLDGPPIVSGRFTTLDGSPFPAGVHVELLALPSSDVMEATAIGQSVYSVPVAKGLVQSDGRFALSIADASMLGRFTSKSGTVDFLVQALAGDSLALYSLSKQLVSTDSTSFLVDPGVAIDTDDAALAAIERGADSTSDVTITALAPSATVRVLAQDRSSTSMNKTDVCGETKGRHVLASQCASGGYLPDRHARVDTVRVHEWCEFDARRRFLDQRRVWLVQCIRHVLESLVGDDRLWGEDIGKPYLAFAVQIREVAILVLPGIQ